MQEEREREQEEERSSLVRLQQNGEEGDETKENVGWVLNMWFVGPIWP